VLADQTLQTYNLRSVIQ